MHPPRTIRLSLLLAGLLCLNLLPAESLAQSHERRLNRPGASQEAIRHRQLKRAYVAGAIAQHRRERIRDHYEDRHHRRHHHHHDDGNDASRVLIGVAVGAIATGIIMHHQNEHQR